MQRVQVGRGRGTQGVLADHHLRAAVRVPQAASTNPVGLARVDRVLLAPLTGRVVVRAGEVAQARLGQARLCRASDL